MNELFEITRELCNGKSTDGGGPPSAFLCPRHVPLNERSIPHLCLLRINVQAEKFLFSSSDWRLLKVSTNAGFAIDSPGVPRVVRASDHIRALRVIVGNVYHNYYIEFWSQVHNKMVTAGRKRLHLYSPFLERACKSLKSLGLGNAWDALSKSQYAKQPPEDPSATDGCCSSLVILTDPPLCASN